MRDSHRVEEAGIKETDEHGEMKTKTRTGNSHKEMKIKGGITGKERPVLAYRTSEMCGCDGRTHVSHTVSHRTAPSQTV